MTKTDRKFFIEQQDFRMILRGKDRRMIFRGTGNPLDVRA